MTILSASHRIHKTEKCTLFNFSNFIRHSEFVRNLWCEHDSFFVKCLVFFSDNLICILKGTFNLNVENIEKEKL